MTTQSLTLSVPDSLYERLRQRARASGRSIESEVLDLLVAVTFEENGVSPELKEALDSLARLDDEALRRAARSRLPEDVTTRLEALHYKRQSEGLSEAEARESAGLLLQYERTMLIRAQAAVLLKQRGYDVADPARI